MSFQGKQLCQNCFASFLKKNSERKEFAPLGGKFYPCRIKKGLGAQGSKQEVTKVVFLKELRGLDTLGRFSVIFYASPQKVVRLCYTLRNFERPSVLICPFVSASIIHVHSITLIQSKTFSRNFT